MGFFSKDKTFKPKKSHKKGTKRATLHTIAKNTLGSGDMSGAVRLPDGEELEEWLAVHTVDFYNEISLLYGTVSDFCTAETCPVMTAGHKYEYRWADGEKIKKPVKVSAPEYIDFLMTWVDGQISNEELFPTSVDVPFPKGFLKTVQVIFKRLFRVYAHIYYLHFDAIESLKAEAHLNTCFKHFVYFVKHFNLVAESELEPLKKLIAELTTRKGAVVGGGGGGGADAVVPPAAEGVAAPVDGVEAVADGLATTSLVSGGGGDSTPAPAT